VIARAQEVLHTLERGEQAGALARLVDDLPLFAAAPAKPAAPAEAPSEIEARLAQVNPDELTPREALEVLYDLRRLLGREEG
jgi:DNA mismatch repair protein MutS